MLCWNRVILCVLMNYHITLPFSINWIFVQGGSFSQTLENTPEHAKSTKWPTFRQIFKRRTPFPNLRRFLWRRVLWLTRTFLGPVLQKSLYCPTSETPTGRIQSYGRFCLLKYLSFWLHGCCGYWEIERS